MNAAEVFQIFPGAANVAELQRQARQNGWLLMAHKRTGALVGTLRPIAGFRACTPHAVPVRPEAA